MIRKAFEVNFDGIVGPTHNYSGLSFGNIASTTNQYRISNPKAAAKQGLQKMFHLHQMGIKQAVLPPHERPYFPAFRALGFRGSDKEIQKKVFIEDRELFYSCVSASPMWAANAATVFPSSDTVDSRVHFIPANLISTFHRSIENSFTAEILQKIFSDPKYFQHHSRLPSSPCFADEGAANHTRFCQNYGDSGIHLFVYGESCFKKANAPKKYPSRQTFEASCAIARTSHVPFDRIIFAQQHPHAIDAGVFHNDVISVGNLNFFFFHEYAFLDTASTIESIKKKAESFEMFFLEVENDRISLKEAVETYLFNSQIVQDTNGTISFIAPDECRTHPLVHSYLEDMISSSNNPIGQLHFFNLRESMQNGGGPACLRLRIVLNEDELERVNPHVFLDENLYKRLDTWIEKYYRDQLNVEDLKDPFLLDETQAALDELTKILQLGSIYSFQRNSIL